MNRNWSELIGKRFLDRSTVGMLMLTQIIGHKMKKDKQKTFELEDHWNIFKEFE